MIRILLIEDNEITREMLSRRLQKRGYEMLFAADGEAGIRTALRDLPDIILLDIGLPGLDGLEVARALRRDSRTSSIPVIALTAYALPADRERAIQAGCNEHEPKPVDLDSLVGKIRNLLGGNVTPHKS